jgi:hypothetical protein
MRVEGSDLYYEERGEGVPILLIHAIRVSCSSGPDSDATRLNGIVRVAPLAYPGDNVHLRPDRMRGRDVTL